MNRMKKITGTISRLKGSGGYSLVEVLVSGMLMTFAVTAAVAVVTTGTQLQSSDNLRRQARAVARTELERNYDFRDFNTIPASGKSTSSVTIDARPGNPLSGQMTTNIVSNTIATNTGTQVPVKEITVQVSWTGTEGISDSISITKIIANAQ